MNKPSFSSCRRMVGRVLVACLSVTPVGVLALQPGQIAPPEVVAAARQAPALVQGGTTVRSLAPQAGAAGLPALRARPAAGHTLVLRQPGNLVGVSYHEVTLVGGDPGQVRAVVGRLAPQAVVRAEPDLGLVLVQLADFEQVIALVPALQQALPGVAVTVPVTWALPRVQ